MKHSAHSFILLVLLSVVWSKWPDDDTDLKGRIFSTSTFSKNPNMTDWAQEGYFLPHETLRRGLFLGQRVLTKFDPSQKWHIDAFFKWFEFEGSTIHGHHFAEEAVLFPAILNVINKQMPSRMAGDHKELMDLVHTISEFRQKFQKPGANLQNLQKRSPSHVEEILRHDARTP